MIRSNVQVSPIRLCGGAAACQKLSCTPTVGAKLLLWIYPLAMPPEAIEYSMPRGCAAGYMPEMNVLVAASDYSSQSNQPLMKNIKVRVAPSTAE